MGVDLDTRPDIVALMRDGATAIGDGPLLSFEDGLRVSGREFLGLVDACIDRIREQVSVGDRVLVGMDNRTEYLVAWFAVVACGGTVVGLNPQAGPTDAAYIASNSGAQLAIVTAEPARTLSGLSIAGLVLITVVDPEPYGLSRRPVSDEARAALPRPADGRITNIFYTSGSTGKPKGCMVDDAYWLRIVTGYLDSHEQQPDDRLLSCLPFFYNDPSWMLLVSLAQGSTLVVMRRFSKSRFWQVVVEHDVTKLFTIGSIPSMMLTAPVVPQERQHKVRFALHVGIPKRLHEELVDRYGIPWLEVYGLTETGGLTGVPLVDAADSVGTGTIGPPRDDVELKLLSDDGSPVEVGQTGEVVVRHPGLFRGYLGKPRETAAAMRDGWFYTGDLAAADERGWLYFVGRKKDVVRRNGENISAAEVEEVVRAHPDVLEAAVRAVPDDIRGEEVEAIVQVTPEVRDRLAPADVVTWCRDRLAPHKVPRYVHIRTHEFPLTPSLRVAKSILIAELDGSDEVPWDRDSDGRGAR